MPVNTRVVAAFAVCGLLASGCAASTGGHPAAEVPTGPSSAPTSAAAASPGPLVHRPARPARPAEPVRTPCTDNDLRKWVFVSLRQQHMWMCARHHVAAETAITSGMVGPYTNTPTGSYHVQGLNRNTTLTLNTGATYPVKYWIPFDAPLFGFHDSSWQHFPYGSPKYRTSGSHGCVHMPLRAIRFLYDWADIGTPVRIKA